MGRDDNLADRLLDGDRRALARAITLVENDDPRGWELVREVYPKTGRAAIVGFTGAARGRQVDADRRADQAAPRGRPRRRGAVDRPVARRSPSGALLGDRIRLTEHFLDPGVFIRSMANRGALGGLSEAALQAALLMDAAGKDDVFLETVGVGQAEVDIIDHADTVVLVLMPGSGDSIQALKAGVMEIPDMIVVNKADHPLTDTMVREIRGVLSLAPQRGWRVPIVKTEAPARRGRAPSWWRSSTSTAPTSRRRARCPSAGGATCATRSSGSARTGCGAELERQLTTTRRSPELLEEVVARRLDPATRRDADPRRLDARAAREPRPDTAAATTTPRSAPARDQTPRRRVAAGTNCRPPHGSDRGRGRSWSSQSGSRRAATPSPRARRASSAPARGAKRGPTRERAAAGRAGSAGRAAATSRPATGAAKTATSEHGARDQRQERGGDLDVDLGRERGGEPIAARAPQQPQREERQREERRPDQQPAVWGRTSTRQSRGQRARWSPTPEAPVGPPRADVVRRQAAEQPVVDRDVEDRGGQRDLERHEAGRPAPAPPQPARGRDGDHRGREPAA